MPRLITLALLIALVLILAASAAQAATVGVHTFSLHDAPGYRTTTPGLYLRTDAGFTAGAMKNSHGRTSIYAAWSISTDESRPISAALTLGAITGYAIAPVVPMAVPSIAARVGQHTLVRLVAQPRYHPQQGANVLHLTLEWRLP